MDIKTHICSRKQNGSSLWGSQSGVTDCESDAPTHSAEWNFDKGTK